MATTFRPTSSRVLAGAIFAIGAVGLLALLIQTGIPGLLRYGWWILLAAMLAWALFWNPRVEVDAAGVRLVNVFRTVTLPWPSIREVDTRWSLTLTTAYGSFRAWAAPAPGRHATARATKQDIEHLPKSSFGVGDSVRAGDTLNSSSGQAAWAVRRQWEALRDAGHLDNPRLEFDRPPTTWHIATIAGLVGLAVLCAAGMVL